ncbi:MAG: isopropylmalate/homocitrate/citramalate synthase, partial [Microbacterium sp.]|nr:isopropylmalate/homocitrate/citramalate synthase [Microbacterium sp.]
LEVSPRHPYVGDLVHTAFSGTHQDAIRKGFAEHRARALAEGRDEAEIAWRVPYLPIDPADIGRTYDAVIRVNSQSGKGGIAYLLETAYGLELPRRLQIDLSRQVQRHTDRTGDEATADDIWTIFTDAYLSGPDEAVRVTSLRVEAGAEVTVEVDGIAHHGVSETGPVDALVEALTRGGIALDILSLHQSSLRAGADAEALTLLEYRGPDGPAWVAGRNGSVLTASVDAVVRAANAVAAAREVVGS